MKLVIDIGNTLFKTAFISDKGQIENKTVFNSQPDFINFINQTHFDHGIISSVGSFNLNLIQNKNLLIFDHSTKIPIINNYASPQTLGLDRLASSIGAWHLFKNKNCLIIDCGSCITYDYITSGGKYLGGGISPGIEMKLKKH